MDQRIFSVNSTIEYDGNTFTLTKELGAGIYARAFLATVSGSSSETGETLVLKGLREEHISRKGVESASSNRFGKEYELLGLLHGQGAHVPKPVHDGRKHQHPFFTMTLAKGKNSGALAIEGSRYGFPEKVAIALAIPFLKTLKLAHSNKIGYRDWDETNIFVDCEGLPKTHPGTNDADGRALEAFDATKRLVDSPNAVTIIDWNVVSNTSADPESAAGDLRRFFSVWFQFLSGTPVPSPLPTNAETFLRLPELHHLSEWIRIVLARGLHVTPNHFQTVDTVLDEFTKGLGEWSKLIEKVAVGGDAERTQDRRRRSQIGRTRHELLKSEVPPALTAEAVEVADQSERIRVLRKILESVSAEPMGNDQLVKMKVELEDLEPALDTLTSSQTDRDRLRGVWAASWLLVDELQKLPLTGTPGTRTAGLRVAKVLLAHLNNNERTDTLESPVTPVTQYSGINSLESTIAFKSEVDKFKSISRTLALASAEIGTNQTHFNAFMDLVKAVSQYRKTGGTRGILWLESYFASVSTLTEARILIGEYNSLHESLSAITKYKKSAEAVRAKAASVGGTFDTQEFVDEVRKIYLGVSSIVHQDHKFRFLCLHRHYLCDISLSYYKYLLHRQNQLEEEVLVRVQELGSERRKVEESVTATELFKRVEAGLKVLSKSELKKTSPENEEAMPLDDGRPLISDLASAIVKLKKLGKATDQIEQKISDYLTSFGTTPWNDPAWDQFDYLSGEMARALGWELPATTSVRQALETQMAGLLSHEERAVRSHLPPLRPAEGPKAVATRLLALQRRRGHLQLLRSTLAGAPSVVATKRDEAITKAGSLSAEVEQAITAATDHRKRQQALLERWTSAGTDQGAQDVVLEDATRTGVAFFDEPDQIPRVVLQTRRNARQKTVTISVEFGVDAVQAQARADAARQLLRSWPLGASAASLKDDLKKAAAPLAGAGSLQLAGELRTLSDNPQRLSNVEQALEHLCELLGNSTEGKAQTWNDALAQAESVTGAHWFLAYHPVVRKARTELLRTGLAKGLEWGKTWLQDWSGTAEERMQRVLTDLSRLASVSDDPDAESGSVKKLQGDWDNVLRLRHGLETECQDLFDRVVANSDNWNTIRNASREILSLSKKCPPDYSRDLEARLTVILGTINRLPAPTLVTESLVSATMSRATPLTGKEKADRYRAYVEEIRQFARDHLARIKTNTRVSDGTRRAWEWLRDNPEEEWLAQYAKRVLELNGNF